MFCDDRDPWVRSRLGYVGPCANVVGCEGRKCALAGCVAAFVGSIRACLGLCATEGKEGRKGGKTGATVPGNMRIDGRPRDLGIGRWNATVQNPIGDTDGVSKLTFITITHSAIPRRDIKMPLISQYSQHRIFTETNR